MTHKQGSQLSAASRAPWNGRLLVASDAPGKCWAKRDQKQCSEPAVGYVEMPGQCPKDRPVKVWLCAAHGEGRELVVAEIEK